LGNSKRIMLVRRKNGLHRQEANTVTGRRGTVDTCSGPNNKRRGLLA